MVEISIGRALGEIVNLLAGADRVRVSFRLDFC